MLVLDCPPASLPTRQQGTDVSPGWAVQVSEQYYLVEDQLFVAESWTRWPSNVPSTPPSHGSMVGHRNGSSCLRAGLR